jgi:DNA-binding beta-propeller fold protein YncE
MALGQEEEMKGKGMRSGKARGAGRRLLTLAALALAAAAIVPTGALAAPPEFWQAEVGQSIPGARGVAASPTTGHVFVSDQEGSRVVEFTAWGSLVKIWGWDVVESGPGDTAPANQFEICVPANGDKCKDGMPGAGVGQFQTAMGVAVDSTGDVYVAETSTSRRVQKFSPQGEFLLSFGGGVNQGGGTPESPGNVCTSAHIENGDTCGAGKEGSGPGEFSSPLSIRNEIASTPDDKVWVADEERIQRFNTSGEYQGQVNVPGEDINSLAVDAAGNLYAAYRLKPDFFQAKEDLRKLDPTSGAVLLSFKAKNPRGVAVAGNGDVYVFDKDALGNNVGRIRHFDLAAKEVEAPFGGDLNGLLAGGLATSSACDIDGVDVFFAGERPQSSFVRAYGPPPDPDICPQPSVPPEITSQYAASVGTDSAAIEAQINPNFFDDATYYLEYGTVECSVGPCETALFPGAPLTSEVTNKALTAHADLEGLQPDTVYRFRFVAESGGGPVFGPDTTFTTRRVPALNTECPNRALRTATSAALPDCRAYEMVSPVDKNGGDATAYFYEGLDPSLNRKFNGLDRSTPDGAKLTYSASSSFADPEGSPLYTQYLATRGAGGWASESIDPPMEGGAATTADTSTSQFKAFSEDLCQGWLMAESGLPLAAGPTEGFRNLYRRDNCATPPAYAWLESSAPEPEPCDNPAKCDRPFLFPDLQGVGREGECAVFRVNDALTADAPKGVPGNGSSSAQQLYLKCEGTPVRLVSVLTSGTAFKGQSSAGTENGPLGPGSDGGGGEGHIDSVERALSEDGSRVYWTTSSAEPPRLFLRFNADQEQSAIGGGACTEATKACTVAVSPSLNTAQFWTANPAGDKAIYSILAGSQAGNLFEFNFNPAEGKGASTKIAGKALGVAGASEDAKRIYFASEEVCSGATPNSEGEIAQAGKANLYLYEEGESCAAGELAFIGTLLAEDISDGGQLKGIPSPVATVPRNHLARASADGEQLAFVSVTPLTGYDSADAASGQADREVFLYDAATGNLVCASCNPSGSRPKGANLDPDGKPLWAAAWIPGYQHQLYGRRLIAANGNRLFFNSLDALALRDVNGAQDVYQWEAPGSGDCTTESPSYSAQNEGCVDLISSGQDSRDSEWVEASASGDDVFFRTEASLVPSDPGSIDIYDARVGGGFPEETPKAACEGDSCQAPPAAPGFQTPASESFNGPGDAKARKARCAKGKVRRKGRCVKRQRKARARNGRRAGR